MSSLVSLVLILRCAIVQHLTEHLLGSTNLWWFYLCGILLRYTTLVYWEYSPMPVFWRKHWHLLCRKELQYGTSRRTRLSYQRMAWTIGRAPIKIQMPLLHRRQLRGVKRGQVHYRQQRQWEGGYGLWWVLGEQHQLILLWGELNPLNNKSKSKLIEFGAGALRSLGWWLRRQETLMTLPWDLQNAEGDALLDKRG